MLSSQGGKASRSEPFYKVVEKRRVQPLNKKEMSGEARRLPVSNLCSLRLIMKETASTSMGCARVRRKPTKIMTKLRNKDGPHRQLFLGEYLMSFHHQQQRKVFPPRRAAHFKSGTPGPPVLLNCQKGHGDIRTDGEKCLFPLLGGRNVCVQPASFQHIVQ